MTRRKINSPTYTVGVICGNCGKDSPMRIPVGQAIEETECLICGCKRLTRAMFAKGYRYRG